MHKASADSRNKLKRTLSPLTRCPQQDRVHANQRFFSSPLGCTTALVPPCSSRSVLHDRFLEQCLVRVHLTNATRANGEVLRSSQTRQTDGANRPTGRRQAAAETHSGISECRGDGERIGQPKCGRHSPRRPTFTTAVEPGARRTRP